MLTVKGIAKLSNPELHSQLKLAAAPQCIGLIAISEATRNRQLKLLYSFPAEKQIISAKLHVLHPPQSLLHEEVRHHSALKVTLPLSVRISTVKAEQRWCWPSASRLLRHIAGKLAGNTRKGKQKPRGEKLRMGLYFTLDIRQRAIAPVIRFFRVHGG